MANYEMVECIAQSQFSQTQEEPDDVGVATKSNITGVNSPATENDVPLQKAIHSKHKWR